MTEKEKASSPIAADGDALRAEAVRLNMRSARLHRCAFSGAVSVIGLHHSQHRMLMFLSDNAGISQKEIARHLEISPAAVAVMLKRLEAEGFLRRTPARGDSRVNEICLTERGQQTVSRTAEIFGGIDAAMFDGFSAEELSSYIALQTKINGNLATLTAHAGKAPSKPETPIPEGENKP